MRPRVALEVATDGEDSVRFVRALGDRILVGRAPECTVRIDSDLSSREHLVLACVRGRWKVQDLGSRNGTWIGRKRVRKARVRVGTVLRLSPHGPTVRIIGLYPDPDRVEDEVEATRRWETLVPSVAPIPPPPPAARPRRVPTAIAPVVRSERRVSPGPWGLLLGMAFGAVVGLEVFTGAFPYEPVAAPGLLAGRLLLDAMPDLATPRLPWILVAALTAYYGLAGSGLQRPLRRWPLLVGLAALHAAAVFLVRGVLP